MRASSFVLRAATICGIVLTVSACAEEAPKQAAEAPAVTVARVVAEDVRSTSSFTGRIEGMFKVDLRARVDGFLEKRLFTEGNDVKDGDLLFVIEKGLYQAAVDEAQAELEKAEALLKLGDIEVARQEELVAKKVAPQAKLDEVTAKRGEAHGAMLAAQAALEKAKLQLSYTDVRAPISGRIGRAPIAAGNYVTAASSPLATIVSQDPIYVNFPVTQRELLAIRKQQGESADTTAETAISVRLADGTRYAEPGKINFFDVTVNQGTDTVQVRAVFPNPNRILVDGQLVTVVAEIGKSRECTDGAAAGVAVGPDPEPSSSSSTRTTRSRSAASRSERGAAMHIVVTNGLAADERVITEGIQKVRPGQVVQPTEAKPEA